MLQEEKLSKLLREQITLKDELSDLKLILRDYKIKSDRLDELKKLQRDLKAQMDEEKERIEDEFMEDSTYADSKEREIKAKEGLKEKTAQIQNMVSEMNVDKPLWTQKFTIDGEPIQLDVEKTVRLYINGKEQK